MDLDRRVTERLRLEHALYIGLAAAALLLRLFWLGHRPLHHDESIHAYYSWRIVTEGISDYRYDPVYHGPTLYYLTAVFVFVLEKLLGVVAGDFTARLVPTLSGVGLVALAWPLRSLIGRREALAYAILVTFSPTLGYYGRSLRHDVPMAFFTLAAVVAFLRYLQAGRALFLYLSGFAIGLAAATKEDIYLTAFTFANVLWIVGLWASDGAAPLRARAARWAEDVWAFVRERWADLATATLVALTLFVVLHTSLLTHPENWNATARALRYWWGQHTIQRIGGPWWYYLPLEVVYEPLIFFPTLVMLARWIRRGAVARIDAFFGSWAIVGFAMYAWAQEKVPWLLVPFLVPQAIVAARLYAGMSGKQLAFLSPVASLTIWSLVASCFVYDAPRTTEPAEASHNEPLVYVQTTYDVPGVLREIRRVTAALGTGTKTSMVVTGDATWPFSWYLRKYPVHWGSLPQETNAPILIVDPTDADRLSKDLGEHYKTRRFAVRGWWQIDWNLVTPSNVLRFLVLRRAWNPQGTTDAVLFVAKDLESRRKTKLRLTPAPPTRTYVSDPAPIPSPRTIGGPGSGPGRFQEPRGIAIDAEGNLIVADSKNNRVQKIDPEGRSIAVWGGPTPGKNALQFDGVCGVAVGSDGSIYVADTWNHRIQKLDRDGNFVLEWREDEPGFWGPRAVAVAPDGSIFVADTGNKRILAYDPGGLKLRSFGKEGSDDGELIEPVGLAIDPANGHLYVADTGNHRVQWFDLEGRFLGKWTAYGWQEFYTEPYLAWRDGILWSTDSHNHRVNAYGSGGKLDRSLGGKDRGLDRPIGIAVSANGEVFVTDTLNHRLIAFPSRP